jgi:hypothetical protein
MVESTGDLAVNFVSFHKAGSHYLIAHSRGFRIYELSKLGDMAKNELCWSQKVEGGVRQAEFLYSNLYDVSAS